MLSPCTVVVNIIARWQNNSFYFITYLLSFILILVRMERSWSWSWSYTSGLGLGLKILVLFPTLAYISVHIRKQHSVNEVIAYEYCVVVRESV